MMPHFNILINMETVNAQNCVFLISKKKQDKRGLEVVLGSSHQ